MVASHYRSPLNFSVDIIMQAKNALERLYTLKDNLDFAIKNATENNEEIPAFLEESKANFINALDDDLNTADAIGVLFTLVKQINILISNKAAKNVLLACRDLFLSFTDVLGFLYEDKSDNLDKEVEELIAKRTEARKNKDFALADSIRDKLKEMGIELLDTKDGVQWRKI